jgi:hypothetical protein
MKKKIFCFVIISFFIVFFYIKNFAYQYYYDDYYEEINLIDIKEIYKNYYLANIYKIEFIFNKKPLDVISINKDIFIRKYEIKNKNNLYSCIVYFQFFNIGTIDLKGIIFNFENGIYDLNGNKIYINKINEKKKYNFFELNRLLSFDYTLLNIIINIIIFVFLILLIELIVYFIKRVKEKYLKIKIKNKKINFLNKIKKDEKMNIKDKIFELSIFIKSNNIVLEQEDSKKIQDILYKYDFSEAQNEKKYLINLCDRLILILKKYS